jgi:hypothetical protein
MISSSKRLSFDEIATAVCDIASEQVGLKREDVSPKLRLIEDLHCDSLALVELLSYRRGRVPRAKGRCLGFRCVGDVTSRQFLHE